MKYDWDQNMSLEATDQSIFEALSKNGLQDWCDQLDRKAKIGSAVRNKALKLLEEDMLENPHIRERLFRDLPIGA